MENIRKPNPKTNSNILSSLFFLYSWESFREGGKNLWTRSNLYQTPDDLRSEVLGDKIERLWKQQHRSNSNLIKVVLKIFYVELSRDGALLIISSMPRLFQPILLGKFLRYFSVEHGISRDEASICVILLILVNFIGVIFTGQFKLYSHTTAMKIKLSCMSIMHRKVMKMRVSTLNHENCGNALTIVSNDLNQFDQSPYHVHFVWASPLFLFSSFFLLIFDAGIPGLVGVIWYTSYMFLQTYSSRVTGKFRNKIAKNTDKRVKLMNELLNSMKIIKIFVWEKVFIKLITSARKNELSEINKVNYLKSLFYTISHFVNPMAVFVGMLSMVLLNEEITVSKVFNLVAYYNSFNFFIAVMFPLSITKATEFQQVLERVDNFLTSEEMNEKLIKPSCNVWNVFMGYTETPETNNVLTLQDLNAMWSPYNVRFEKKTKCCNEMSPLLSENQNQFVLGKINLSLSEKEFLGIIGPVGSGKSCLIETILGETFSSGFVSTNGRISYASQDPWIFHGTIRENIVFGEIFDEKRYLEVLQSLGLNQDLEQFPERDLVVVGERGASLSGGQKSRINLARAVYRKSDIYLLDNPLASLDVHVANQILESCIINGFLKDKCRILVSHCVQQLEKCDRIVVLNSGRIEFDGTYERVRENTKELENFECVDKESTPNIVESFESCFGSNKVFEENVDKRLVFLSYLKSGNNVLFIFLVLFTFIFNQLMNTSIFYYVSFWANLEEKRNRSMENVDFEIHSGISAHVYIFAALLGIYLVGSIAQAVLFSMMVIRNSRKIHENLLKKLMNCDLKFFDETESGKIMTRFTKDLGYVDDQVVRNLIQSFVVIFSFAVKLLVITYLNPYMIFIVFFTVLFLSYSTKLFVRTTQNLKRLESSLIEPVLTHFNATIQGLATIRAAKAQNMMKDKFNTHQDLHASSYYMYITVSYAFSFAVEFMCFIFISIVTTSCFLMKDVVHLNGGEIGLMISQAVLLATSVQFGIIQLVSVKNNLVSVERIFSYNKLPQEIRDGSETVEENWPRNGAIKFENVKVWYQNIPQPPVLDLSFEIRDKEKIGIVGRTGAGKSSIFNTLLRLVEFRGVVEIDSNNIEEIPLNILRSRIGVIPQDPVLFSGTLRFNLDPLGEFDDSLLYETLNKIGFSKVSGSLKNLNDDVKANGVNLSLGQRQLICLARVLMRKNRIVLLDEATSNMDARTDELIRKVIREQFSECTVLTISHKLSTVMEFDRVMVIDSGKIVQFDCPKELMRNRKGEFYNMMKQQTSITQ